MTKLIIDINSGEKTCAKEKGVFCHYLKSRIDGFDPVCSLFDRRIYDKDGSIMGWLLRCKECIDSELSISSF
jgi:hypothetical protein